MVSIMLVCVKYVALGKAVYLDVSAYVGPTLSAVWIVGLGLCQSIGLKYSQVSLNTPLRFAQPGEMGHGFDH